MTDLLLLRQMENSEFELLFICVFKHIEVETVQEHTVQCKVLNSQENDFKVFI